MTEIIQNSRQLSAQVDSKCADFQSFQNLGSLNLGRGITGYGLSANLILKKYHERYGRMIASSDRSVHGIGINDIGINNVSKILIF